MKKLIVLCLGLSLLLPGVAGCKTAAKKPITQVPPRTGKITQPRTTTPGTTTNKTMNTANSMANKMANAAKKVKGVKGATVAVSGTTAYVGIDLDANVKGKMTDKMKKDVAKEVKKVDKKIKNVYVTSDVGIVTRIKDVAKGIAAGKPLTSFTTELTEIGRRIMPNQIK